MEPWMVMTLEPMNPQKMMEAKQGPSSHVYISKVLGILPNESEARKAETALCDKRNGLYIVVPAKVFADAESLLEYLKDYEPVPRHTHTG